jgi:RHS repeat-associated protein
MEAAVNKHGRMWSGNSGLLRAIAVTMVATVGTGLAFPVPARADDGRGRPKVRQADKTVKTTPMHSRPRLTSPKAFTNQPLPAPTWPKPGIAEVAVPSPATGGSNKAATPRAVRAGTTPVWIAAPDTRSGPHSRSASSGGVAQVRVIDQTVVRRAGLTGTVFTIGRTAPTARDGGKGLFKVGLDYAGFATAYGASYGPALRLVRYPACVLTTPAKPECRTGAPVPTLNDTEHQTLSADVTAGAVPPLVSASPSPSPSDKTRRRAAQQTRASASNSVPESQALGDVTVLAAEPGDASDKGDYKATSLAPSATTNVGTQTGEFHWRQEFRVPPVPGNLKPEVSLAYDSGSVDGRTSNTNAQSSWAGDGFELWPGYIERRYRSCEDAGAPKPDGFNYPADQCWGYDNATINWNGKAGELIPAGNNKWRLRNDDGTRIEKLIDAAVDNGDNDNEYWKITTTDGTQYYFGYDKKVPGGTKSTWTTPVFGVGKNDPCYKDTGFKDSWCQQGWRWNLDYVEDRNGNAITYTYAAETNNYGRVLKAKDRTPYVRGGFLREISYGLRKDKLSATPPAKVVFSTAERCLSANDADCDESKIDANRLLWQDTPWYLNCGASQDCDMGHGAIAPTFWTRKRLIRVTTQIVNTDTTKCGGKPYCDVDSWSLAHEWGEADSDRSLLLKSVQHAGHGGATTQAPIALPPITFAYKEMPNRVDKLGDTEGPFLKYRMTGVNDDAGGQLSINYLPGDCKVGDTPTPETNGTRCMPVMWEHGTVDKPSLDWFHKYVVDTTASVDRTGYSPQVVTKYNYQGPAAWHFDDDDGITKEKYRTWNQWRGYAKVSVQTGGLNDPKTQTDHIYLRGMNGDRGDRAGAKKLVRVSDEAADLHDDGKAKVYDDDDALQGFELKQVVRNGPGGPVHSVVLNEPWQHQTASRTRSWGTISANLTGISSATTYTEMGAPGSWRTTRVNTRYDDETGRKVWEDDQGDVSTHADDRCTRTSYNDDDTRWFKSFSSRVDVVSQGCDVQEPDRKAHPISDTLTTYDGTANVKETKRRIAADGGADDYQVKATIQKLDVYGRPLEVLDANKNLTKTSYTETGGLTTSITTTSPHADPANAASPQLVTTQTLQPAWNFPTVKVDAGKKRTDLAYDPLGRLTKVWLPDRPRDRNPIPNIEYSYQVEENKIAAVGTRTVTATGGQTPYSYVLYDASLRPRQTQAPGPQGGRLVTDTFYNTLGKVQSTYTAYYSTGAPEPTLMKAGQVETQTRYTYDGLGRVLTEELADGGGDAATKWQTTTTYHGNAVHVEPPTGGTPTTTFTDARDNKTKVIQHSPDGKSDVTQAFGYDHAGRLETTTGPGGKKWEYRYDLLGRKTETTDPDSGTTSSHYNALDQLTWTQDARGQKIYTSYDALGRKTESRAGSATGTLLTSWAYDSVRVGQLTSTSRWALGPDGKTHEYKTQVNTYDALNRATSTTITIPAEETLPGAKTGLGQSYTFNTAYNPDGTVQSTGIPAAGDLAAETIVPRYDTESLQRPVTLTGLSTYVSATKYSLTGKPEQYQLEAGGKKAWLSYGYENTTQRLKTISVDRQDVPGTDLNATYTYDDAGNITSVVDDARANATTPGGGTRGIDTQCFRYDFLRQLTDAWAQNGGACASDPNTATIGGPAPYRIHYDLAADGSRTKELQYTSAGLASTRDYLYAGDKGPDGQTIGGTVHGHMLGAVTQTGASPFTGADTNDETYTYDEAGNTKTRKIGNQTQTFTWDTENKIQKINDAGNPTPSANGDTTFVYGADGNRLIRRDPTSTTLYLPGMELKLAKGEGSTPTATRYYSHNGQTIATRTSKGVTLLTNDHQGTAQLSIDAADTTKLTQRRQTPFGQPRDPAPPAWLTSMDKGFVGGTNDATGLTHLGAREYDPDTGRFISVDPIFNADNPQSWNGYGYANNNPITASDPTGTDGPLKGNTDCYYANKNCPKKKEEGEGKKSYPPSFNIPEGPGRRNRLHQMVRDIIEAPYDPETYRIAVQAKAAFCSEFPDDSVCTGGDLHKSLDIAGNLPGGDFFDAFNAALYISEGDWKNALVSGAAVAPGVGGFATARRITKDLRLCNSFAPGTKVLMADGSHKRIEDVKVGDRVIATDPKTGKTGPQTVLASVGGTSYRHLIKITVATKSKHGQHVGLIIATEHHRFWNPTQHRWVRADQLSSADHLRTPAGHLVRVLAVTFRDGHPQVRDLTIADTHTFYVLAGNTPVLVHNADKPCVDIYKAPGKNMTDKLLDDGFDPADFPGSGNGFPDGNAYFGMHDEGRQIALDYAGRGAYDGTVIRVRIPQADFDKYFSKYVTSYDGRPGAQIAIPNTVFDLLNSYPRLKVHG